MEFWSSRRAPSQHYVELDALKGICHVYWDGRDNQIPLTDLETPLGTLSYIQHIGTKNWPLMNAERIAAFIEIVADHYGWKVR
ncbi:MULTISPECIES: hypothetical protein [unclassified Brevundimonas]|uniref:hypothetical protein n=1 Tax=unclassified Brevundimonas TaxID=2622653 RepID=UPI0025BF3FB3|nr:MULTISPECIES: hypothetical protein [unclassified Brevundimonas]